ncbi:LOW QUALITY PROTEIN: GTP-binding protein At3g49725, chloroplastic [Dioscorea cayenensis subsp. rotundata]|uniref:LOW QUALITY PROTEIN: GTP-binding protein At3g49725, chloroplastic n=1 Tax=Dioscorea cayennensis subsp. rotundata TaxID=55577 RepID=A0AB40CIF1_DIOCR|nr:LOW QUALITY PROTEIN: GTP-binding protein At3g49725, chloroplastic [Dioscorea cayenensis subsp. rotundata]
MLRAFTRLRAPLRSLPENPNPASPFSRSSRRGRKEGEASRDEDDNSLGVFVFGSDHETPPRLLILQPRLRPDSLLNSKLGEAINLANSLEEQRDGFFAKEFADKNPPPHLIVQNPASRSRTHADTFFGPGTVDNVKCHLRALETEDKIDAVFVNTILSGVQQRNLEVAWGKPVLDRVGLIIEIFNAHAETKEAKLQSELAGLMYKKTRLVRVRGPSGRLTFGASGEAEVVSAKGRGTGGRGFISGAGETELQLQRRRILERRNHLLSQIEEVRRTRALQRASRRRHGGTEGQGLATVAIVGYTNAGKSTLVSALSESYVFSDDRLFATVDPRVRSVILPSGRKALLSDTVGFISDLPVQLVEAFHATLEEVVEADLLVHVLDSSAPNLVEQRSSVLQVLQQIGVAEEKIQNMIEVWNKIDLLKGHARADEILDGGEYPSEVDEDMASGESADEDGMHSGLSSNEQIDNNEMISEVSCDELIDEDELVDEDGIHSERLSSSEPIDDHEITSEVSCDEPVDDDEMVFELSSVESKVEDTASEQEVDETAVFSQVESSKAWEMIDLPACGESKEIQRVETSAVMGIGLQELLSLIDEKLAAQKPVLQKNLGAFDRKWRPSQVYDDEKVAEQ